MRMNVRDINTLRWIEMGNLGVFGNLGVLAREMGESQILWKLSQTVKEAEQGWSELEGRMWATFG